MAPLIISDLTKYICVYTEYTDIYIRGIMYVSPRFEKDVDSICLFKSVGRLRITLPVSDLAMQCGGLSRKASYGYL